MITIRLFFSKAIWQFQHLKIPWSGALDPWERGHPENTTLCLLASDIPERALLLGRGGGRWWSWRGNLGQLGTKRRPQQPFQAINPIPSSSGSWLPRTRLLLAPEDHSPVGQGTTLPVSLCLFYAGGRSMVALQESEQIHRHQPCNFNRGVFLISLCIPLANERAIDACGKGRAGSWHSTLHTLFIILGSSSVLLHSRA